MKIVCYSHDQGGVNLLREVARMARKRPWDACTPEKAGLPWSGITDQLTEADALLVVPSSFEDYESAAILDAAREGVPAYVLEDVPGALRRIKDEKAREAVETLFLAYPFEGAEKEAPELGYHDVVFPGFPAHWEGTTFPLLRARQVDKRRDVLFIIGSKDPVENNRMLAESVSALRKARRGDLKVVFAPHPRENEDAEAQKERERLMREHTSFIWRYKPERKAEYLARTRIVMATGGSTDTISCAFARVPMLYFMSEGTRERNRRQGFVTGRWFVEEYGGMIPVGSGTNRSVEEGVAYLLSEEGAAALKRAQEEHFALPEAGHSAEMVIDHIASRHRFLLHQQAS